MADYYPLIARAVAGLDKNNGENRRALYERARAALLGQLRSVTPALNESDITRERLALEESIRKVEAESARKFVETPRQPAAPRIRPIEPRRAEDAEEHSPPPRRYVNPPAPPSQQARSDVARQELARQELARQELARQELARQDLARQDLARQDSARQDSARQDAARQDLARQELVRRPRPPSPPSSKPAPASPALAKAATPDVRPAGGIGAQPHPSELDSPPPRHPLRRPAPDRRFPLEADGKELRNVASDTIDLDEAAVRAEKSPRDAYTPPPMPELGRAQRSRDRTQDYAKDYSQEDYPSFDRSEPRTLEPQAPDKPMFEPEHEPSAHDDYSEPMLESSFALDDRPAAGKARRAALPAAQVEELERPAKKVREKLAWRPSRQLIRALTAAVAAFALVGILAWQWSSMVALYRSMRAPAVETARDTPSTSARPKITDRIEPGGQASPAPVPGTQAGAAVAQKVVLYEEDPADPNGKRFVGSAIWRTETVTSGPGQPPELAIRADVEVPERKLAMTWSLRRNADKALPASHTVEIIFKLPADFVSGGISNVPGILMKAAEQTRGVPLAGLAVKVTNGFFLIGLSSVEADKERNLQLLKDRAWFDIPVVYNNNRRAILAMEKGTPGERAFAEAFKVWKQ
jgi:hypothetical protein